MNIRKILFVAAALIPVLVSCTGGKDSGKIRPVKNVILMVPDGTSTSVLSVVRWFREYGNPQNAQASLSFDPYVCGLVRQYCSDSPIAGSPAAMSAYMTGYRLRSPNLSIYPKSRGNQDIVSIDTARTFQPLATSMEAAKILKGKATGLVVTVKADHATPAATASHCMSRNDDHTIIRQMASNDIDVVFGGGTKYMEDDVKAILEENGTRYIEKDLNAFRSLESGKAWALFADSEMSFDADRDSLKEPSLSEMTSKALQLLSRNRKGFFLMVEGSHVDYAAHSNDPMGIISEMEAFDKAVSVALDFAEKDGNTTVIVVPDHGNSAMTIGDRNYTSYSDKGLDSAFVMLPQYRGTSYALSGIIQNCPASEIRTVFKERTGIDLTDAEEKAIIETKNVVEQDYMKVSFSWNIMSVVTSILNSHTHIGYVSGSHTSEDVFLAVYNPYGQTPSGVIDGTELSGYICAELGLPETLDELTSQIYVRHDVLLKGRDFAVKGADGSDKPGKDPVLSIDGGRITVPANRSYAMKGDTKIPLGSVSVYVPQNGMFYVSGKLLDCLK